MMNNYLVFSLYGPMAAWGDIAVGGMRPSHRHPTKSAIFGLLAAAQGIQRVEEERLQQLQKGLGFAVRLDVEGQLIIDYHTTQVPTKQALKNHPHATRRDELMAPKLTTILSDREYYCDALYTIVLWQRNDKISLAELKDSLRQPSFTLYLGRKSCPLAMPIFSLLCEADAIEDALAAYDNQPVSKSMRGMLTVVDNPRQKSSDNVRLCFDIDGVTKIKQGYQDSVIRRDKLFNRQRWQYAEREERRILLESTKE